MAQASYGYFGIGNEVTAGTAVAPTQFLPVKDVDFTQEKEFIEIREIRGSRQAYSNFDGPVRPAASFTTAFYGNKGMGNILRGVFGSVTTTAAPSSSTAFVHSFNDAAVLPSMSFERSDARASGGILHQRMNGVKIESFGVTAAYGEDVEVSVAAQGLGFPTLPGSKPSSFSYPTIDPFIFTGASVEIDGVTSDLFKSIDFEFSNTLERQEALRGVNSAYKMYEGGMAVTLSGTLIFDDNVLYNKFRDSQYLTVTAEFVSAADQLADDTNTIPYSARFHFPKVKISNIGLAMTAGEVIEADVEFQVSFDYATSKLVDVQLVNTDASGSYAL